MFHRPSWVKAFFYLIILLFFLLFSTDYFSQERRKKKKKKKKRNAAIVSIEDDNQQDFVNDSMEFPLSDASVKETVNSSCDCKRSSLGHSRSSSYPGNITVGTEGSAVKTSRMNGTRYSPSLK